MIDFSRDVDILTVQDAEKSYPTLMATARTMFPSLPESEIARVVSLVVGTCGDCREAASGCACSRDD